MINLAATGFTTLSYTHNAGTTNALIIGPSEDYTSLGLSIIGGTVGSGMTPGTGGTPNPAINLGGMAGSFLTMSGGTIAADVNLNHAPATLGGTSIIAGDIYDSAVSMGSTITITDGTVSIAGAFNLSMPSSFAQSLSTEVGARFQRSVMVHKTLLQPLASVSILQEKPLKNQEATTLHFTDSSDNFTSPTSNERKTYAIVAIGCSALFKNNIILSPLLTGKVSRHEQAAEFVLKGSYGFN